MEIPAYIRDRYRHWDAHVRDTASLPNSDAELISIPDELSWFVRERVSIWKKKVSGEASPYTEDPILQNYRFCNIFREFDRQTMEIHEWLNPIRNDFSLWLLNAYACRMIARPETNARLGYLTFDEKQNSEWYEGLISLPKPRYGSPYVFPVSTIMKSEYATRERFLTYFLPKAMPSVAKEIERFDRISAYEWVSRILPIFGFNHSFLWTEVLIDVAYQFPERIDLFARFPIGPWAMPTLKRIAPAGMDHSEFVAKLARLPVDTDLEIDGKPLRISAENWEGIACEYRKYTNLKNGNGRKRLFLSKQWPAATENQFLFV